MKYGNSNEKQIQKLDTQIIAPDGQMSNEISRRSLNLKACISHLASYLSKMHILPFMGCGVTFYNLHCPMCGFSTLCDGGKITQPNEKRSKMEFRNKKKLKFYLISATFDPPLPMMQPISSLGTVISWVCWLLAERPWPLSMASAENWTSVVLS